MKRFLLLLLILGALAPIAHAQDAATEERLTKLAGQIDDLQAASVQTQKRLADLAKDLEELKQGQGKAGANYATQDDIKKLTSALQDIDQKRVDDNDKIVKEIEKLGKVTAPAPDKKKTPVTPVDPTATSTSSNTSEKGYDYIIKANDTLSTIVSAYRDQNIKITIDSILKANPNVKPNSLRVGQKIFIPAPQ